jgi:hypothetical protein
MFWRAVPARASWDSCFNRGGGTLAPAQQIDLSPNLTGPAQALFVRDVNFDGTADLLVGSNQAPAYLLIANISP